MNKESIHFRSEILPADAEKVQEIVKATGVFYDEEIGLAAELVEERLAKGIKSGYDFTFVEINGRAVGYSCFGPIPITQKRFDLYWIAVHPDFGGQGIGKKIMTESEKRILEQGGERIYIETSSRQPYGPARGLYASAGYSLDAVIKDFYAPGDNKCLFVKQIR